MIPIFNLKNISIAEFQEITYDLGLQLHKQSGAIPSYVFGYNVGRISTFIFIHNRMFGNKISIPNLIKLDLSYFLFAFDIIRPGVSWEQFHGFLLFLKQYAKKIPNH